MLSSRLNPTFFHALLCTDNCTHITPDLFVMIFLESNTTREFILFELIWKPNLEGWKYKNKF